MDTRIISEIVDRIEGEIVSGQLLPGALLQQEALAKRFNVSRQPVRAALEILGAKELIERRPDRSVAVRALSTTASDELLAIRRLLEPEALALAIDRLTDRDLLLARHALERFEIEPNPHGLAQLDMDFHIALYRPCGNQTLVDLIGKLRLTNIRAYLGQPLGSSARRACIDAHRDILEACKARKRDEACNLLLAHFDIAKEREK